MTETDKRSLDIAEAGQDIWDTYRKMKLSEGFDVDQNLKAWTAEQRQRLESPGARTDFDELCEAGCVPLVLASLIQLIRFSPQIGAFLQGLLGDPEKREKTRQALEDASVAFQGTFREALTLETEEVRAHLEKLGRLPPSRLVAGIEFYTAILKSAEQLPAELGLESFLELTKYLLAGYVERATGRPRDRNVSALIGDILGPPEYNEVAQRMWRFRNYERLKKNYQFIPEILFALTSAATRRT